MKKQRQINVKVTPETKERFIAAAQKMDRNVSEHFRILLNNANSKLNEWEWTGSTHYVGLDSYADPLLRTAVISTKVSQKKYDALKSLADEKDCPRHVIIRSLLMDYDESRQSDKVNMEIWSAINFQDQVADIDPPIQKVLLQTANRLDVSISDVVRFAIADLPERTATMNKEYFLEYPAKQIALREMRRIMGKTGLSPEVMNELTKELINAQA